MPANVEGIRTVAPWNGGPLVRIHCGLESAGDLIQDLSEGLAAARFA